MNQRELLEKQIAQMSDQEVVARHEARLRLAFAHTFVEPCIAKASNDNSAKALLPNHIITLGSHAKAQLFKKCRKTAHSWGFSLFALAQAATVPRSQINVGSYDEEEARNKLYFLDWIYSVLPFGDRRDLGMTDGSESRKFRNGSVVNFLTRKAPTGAGGFYLGDEFSIEPKGRVSATDILTAALGATTHRGAVRLAGTERDEGTLFYQIGSGEWQRMVLEDPLFQMLPQVQWEVINYPWWLSPALCIDVEAAAHEAPLMETRDRVVKFGNTKLKEQFMIYLTTVGLGLPMFQREFEIKVVADGENYFDLEELQSCYAAPGDEYWFKHCEVKAEDAAKYKTQTEQPGNAVLNDAKEIILDLKQQFRRGALRGNLGFAQDVGRHSDRDEILIGHDLPEDRHHWCLRANITMNNMAFDGKQELLEFMFEHLPITRGAVDGTRGSVGVQLAEWAEKKWNFRARAAQFTTPNRQIWTSGMKARIQAAKVTFPHMRRPDLPRIPGEYRELQEQFLAVKKLTTPTGVTFDVERTKKHHGDKYWGCALLNDLFDQLPTSQPQNARIIKPKESAPAAGRLYLPAGYAGRGALHNRGNGLTIPKRKIIR